MTKLAQSATSPTHNHRSTLHGELPSPRARVASARAAAQGDGLLQLTGGRPVTVNMSVIAENVVVFWLPPSPDTQPQLFTGISWLPDIYALMITFVFAELPRNAALPPGMPAPLPFTAMVSELVPTTPMLWLSDTFPETNPSSQMCCVPSTLGEFHFDAMVDEGLGILKRYRSLDPKIIVTPIVT
jgi:hypothetical protein